LWLEPFMPEHDNLRAALDWAFETDTWSLWLEPFMPEHDNLRAALDWAFENAPDLGLRLVLALNVFWFHSNYLSEGREYLTRALELMGASGSTQARKVIMGALEALAWQQGDYAAARALSEECATIHRKTGNQPGLAQELFFLGRMTELIEGPHAAARSFQEESVAIWRAVGDKRGLATALYFLGSSLAAQGDEARARTLQEESVALYRESGGTWNIATPLGYLGYQALRQGNYEESRSFFSESLTLARGWHKWGIAWRLEGFAGLAVKEEEPARAARLYGAAQALLDSIGARLDSIDRLGYDQYVASAREQLGEAAFAREWATGRAMTVEQAIKYALATDG
jgi:non-specific serine/threonine protein kinase